MNTLSEPNNETKLESRNISVTSSIRLCRERFPEMRFAPEWRAALPRLDRRLTLPNLTSAGAPSEIRPRLFQNLCAGAFPYPRYLRTGGIVAEREFKLVRLENQRFSLTVAPEMGGRVLSLFDRTLNTQLFWQPPVLRNAAIGLAGAWMVGGMEFNAFRYGHLVCGQSCLLAEEVELAGGWRGIRLSAVDEMFHAAWSVILVALPDQVAMRIRLENLNDCPVPGYWWTNISVPAHNDTKLFYKPGPVLHHGTLRNEFVLEQWPMLHGRDWSEWINHHEVISAYLLEYGSDYFGSCDRQSGVALAHHTDRQTCRGRKLWSLGSHYDNVVWLSRMGEPAIGSYVELQCGRMPTQIESDLLAPGQIVEWTESLTSFAWGGGHPAAPDAGFNAFEKQAAEAIQPSARAIADSGNWRVLSARVLVAEDERLAASRTAVCFPEKIDGALANAVCERGWVAGPGWAKALLRLSRMGQLGSSGELALAVAELDMGDGESAQRRLRKLVDSPTPEVRGWANLILALTLRHAGSNEGALPHFQAAAADLSANLDAVNVVHDVFVLAGAIDAIRALWQSVPESLRQSDAGRYARAQLAFLRGDYAGARALLTAPMYSIGENAFNPWMLWKEAHLAEALVDHRDGRQAAAAQLLTAGGEAAPQFSLGRSEPLANLDLFYYRWRLASERDQELLAETLAGWLLRAQAFPSTTDAAYLVRVATECAHPSAMERLQAIALWESEAHDIDLWAAHPLHQAVMSAVRGLARAGWERLCAHWLYRPRAEFELGKLENG